MGDQCAYDAGAEEAIWDISRELRASSCELWRDLGNYFLKLDL